MGLGCSKRKDDAAAPLVVRLSPFRPRRVLSRLGSAPPTPRAGAGGDDPALPANTDPGSLLSLALDAVAATLPQQPARELACLPADLSQLLLERLVAAGRLDDDTVLRLSGLGLHFFRLPLGAYPELVRPFWLRCLASPSLEAADLSKTGVRGRTRGMPPSRHPSRLPPLHPLNPPPVPPATAPRAQVTDDALAALGAPPRLHTLRLDYCVEITDAGLALLQGARRLSRRARRPAQPWQPPDKRQRKAAPSLARILPCPLTASSLHGPTPCHPPQACPWRTCPWWPASRSRRWGCATWAASPACAASRCRPATRSGAAGPWVAGLVRFTRAAFFLGPLRAAPRTSPQHPTARPPTLRSNLALLQRLTRLESLDLGYCSNVTDADAAVLERFGRLQELSLARTQVGLASLGSRQGAGAAWLPSTV